MKFDPTKPVQTRDGRKARIICTDAKGDYSIVALVEEANGEEEVAQFRTNGAYYDDVPDTDDDLINVPEKHVFYINIYPDKHPPSWIRYESRKDADNGCSNTRTACIRVEFKEGQFDE